MSSRMPPHHLWTGAARIAYERVADAAPYGAMRANPAAELVRGSSYDQILCLGAGPDPVTEAGALGAIAVAAPLHVLVHDITISSASAMCGRLAQLVDASAVDNRSTQSAICEFTPISSDLRHPELCARLGGPFALTTLLGYTLGNFTDAEALDFLRQLAPVSRQLLLDVPVAWDGDPRLHARAFDPGAETAWLEAAYTDWHGCAPRTSVRSDVEYYADGYVVRVMVGNDELLRFRRRSVSGWIALFEKGGWSLRKGSVTDGHPRLAALLTSAS